MEDANGPPFTGQNQFGKTISIQITPNRAADQTNLFQPVTVLLIKLPRRGMVAINPRGSRLRIPSGDNPATGEQFQIAVTVDISQRKWADARIKIGHYLLNCRAFRKLLNPTRHRLALFVIRESRQNPARLTFLAPNCDARLVNGQRLIEWRPRYGF